ncbi:MAG: heme o synthase [Gemmatimonadota bacterium]
MHVARAFLELTKPGITVFIGASTASGFLLALGGWGEPGRLLLVLVATMAMSGGAAAHNHLAERGTDARMRRTAGRPLPAGIIRVRDATLFAWGLGGAGFLLALLTLPWQTTLFLVLCHVSYVNVYTPLKRRSPLSTLAGAVPGALPVLAGAAATGLPLSTGSVALAAVLFTWQVPHFLSLAWLAREDYARAGQPMLGVLDPGGSMSARVSLLYAAAMPAFALAAGWGSAAGGVFTAGAVLCGGAYLVAAARFVRVPGRPTARTLFLASLLVLPLLLATLAADLVLSI